MAPQVMNVFVNARMILFDISFISFFWKYTDFNSGLMKMFQQTNQGVCFRVNVIPKASRSEIVECNSDELKIRLAAVPEKGKANTELVRYLAHVLGIGKSKVELLRGETSRHKRVCIKGMALEEVQTKIQDYLSNKGEVSCKC